MKMSLEDHGRAVRRRYQEEGYSGEELNEKVVEKINEGRNDPVARQVRKAWYGE